MFFNIKKGHTFAWPIKVEYFRPFKLVIELAVDAFPMEQVVHLPA